MAKSVYIADVCKEIFAGGDVPKDALSYEKTEEYNVPIFSSFSTRDNWLHCD